MVEIQNSNEKDIFMLMPFDDKLDEIYTKYIKKPLENRGFIVRRADDFYKSTDILEDILNSIENSDIIIADLTKRNPNVFYEVGYAHCVQKEKVILISQEKSRPIEIENVYNSQRVKLVQKFKNLYNRLASKNPEHVIIEIKTIVEDIGKIAVREILRMEYVTEQDERIMLIEPKEWNLSIRTGSHRHLRLQKYINGNSQSYDFEFPDQNEEILNEFLKFLKERCEEQGINV